MTESKARLTARGIVQGVFFRAFTQDKALSLGLKGFARNLPSGNEVEVIAVGEKKQIEQLTRFLMQGPPASRVENVETKWLEFKEKEFTGFEIRY